eukprot:5301165-Alexandrium_andersonii.AAC.1
MQRGHARRGRGASCRSGPAILGARIRIAEHHRQQGHGASADAPDLRTDRSRPAYHARSVAGIG